MNLNSSEPQLDQFKRLLREATQLVSGITPGVPEQSLPEGDAKARRGRQGD